MFEHTVITYLIQRATREQDQNTFCGMYDI